MIKAAAKLNPFKTRTTRREGVAKTSDTLTPPDQVAHAIDAFREAQDQAKHYEGEATVQKDVILDYSEQEFSKRLLHGSHRSFKLLGDESTVTYVVMNTSAGLTEEDLAEFARRWGREAAEDLISRDYASARFDGDVFEAHYEEVVEALQTLPKEVLENLFKPMLLKAKPGALDRARHYAKSADDLRELLRQLKIKNYIR